MTRYEWLRSAVANHMEDSCLLWPFGKDRQGYGKVWFEGDTVRAHRVAFKLVHGKWPEPLGLHSCDTPSCVSPFHVSEGTNADNQGEKAARGRQIRGEMHKCSKLNPELVRQIRSEYIYGVNGLQKLANKFGISKKTVMRIIHYEGWKHIQ